MQNSKQIINLCVLFLRRPLLGPLLILPLLILTAFSGCQPHSAASLQLQLQWQGQPLRCDSNLTLGSQTFQLAQLQLFLSDFRQNQSIALTPGPYSNDRLVLLGIDCQSNDAGQWQIPLANGLTPGPLSFTLSVPALLNHQNPLLAEAPLQQTDMHWSWQHGYKFLRLDLTGHANWSLHLGATGCSGPSVMRAPTTPCQQPNQVQVNLQYSGQQTLVLDLAPLLQDFGANGENSCMSDPQTRSCRQLLPRLGVAASAVEGLWQLR
ncbi:MAG: metallo-mystery pair system four-Cys motif protein [Rheinheimera sp.]|nr:metallo-mystery pair system four-Cys motif protein [Rheinheimera sp.]